MSDPIHQTPTHQDWNDKFVSVRMVEVPEEESVLVEGIYRRHDSVEHEVVFWNVKDGWSDRDACEELTLRVTEWAKTDTINTIIAKMDALGHVAKHAVYFGQPTYL